MKNVQDIYSTIRIESKGNKNILKLARENQYQIVKKNLNLSSNNQYPVRLETLQNLSHSPNNGLVKTVRAHQQLRKPKDSQMVSKKQIEQNSEITVKNLMQVSSIEHMIYLCSFDYICQDNKKTNENFKHLYNISIKQINFNKGVCYYDRRKTSLNLKFRVSVSINSDSTLDELNFLINQNNQNRVQRRLSFQSKNQTYNFMCKVIKKKIKLTVESTSKRQQKCVKDQINETSQVSPFLSSKTRTPSLTHKPKGMMVENIAGNLTRIDWNSRNKSQEGSKFKRTNEPCDKETVLKFFEYLPHSPIFNEELPVKPYYAQTQINFSKINTIPQVKSNKKYFLISDKYPVLKEKFLQRDWEDVEEEQMEERNPQFDFSYYWFSKDERMSFQLNQIIQGFQGLHYTSKIGMYTLLKKLTKKHLLDIEWFFPTSFDLSDKQDVDKFVQYFLANQCQRYILLVTEKLNLDDKTHFTSSLVNNLSTKRFEINQAEYQPGQLKHCLRVVETTLLRHQWASIDFLLLYKFLISINMSEHYDHIHKLWVQQQYDMVKNSTAVKQDNYLNGILNDYHIDGSYWRQIINIEKEIGKLPQGGLNQGQNRWILKPHDLSRGRAITVHSDLGEMLDIINCKKTSFMVQKQIEKPLLQKNRKLDIRIWTVLTSSAPVISWVQQKFQVRLSSKKFEVDNDDKQVNLTNQSIQKNNWHSPDECMLDYDQFKAQLMRTQSRNGWEIIIRQIQSILGLMTLAGNDLTERRMNTWTILGWDFMVDTELNVWLIEANRSPDLSHSTSVTEKLVKQMFTDLASMMIDQNFKDLNSNDEINNIGQFLKLTNASMNKNINKLLRN